MSTKNNKNAAHEESPLCALHIRCVCGDKLRWKAAADKQDGTLSSWVVATLNRGEFNSQQHPIGSILMFNGREVRTRSEVFSQDGRLLVKIAGRQAGVPVSELTGRSTAR